MLSVLGQRNYALLWWAAFISGIGNFVLIAALPYFVYTISGSTLASGAAFFSEMVPTVIFGAVGGIYADRWRRKPVLVVSDWLRGVILLPLVAVHSPSLLWIVYVTAFLGAAAANFAGPFGSAAVPHVVRQDQLAAANTAFTVGGHIAVLIGSPLGGILLQRLGLGGVAVVDAVSFAVSGLLVAGVRTKLERRDDEPPVLTTGGLSVSRAWRDWLAGLQYILGRDWLRLFFVVTMLVALANSMALVLLAPFVRHVLGGSPQVYSWVLMAQAVGAIASTPVMRWITTRLSGSTLLSWSILAFGVLNVVIAAAVSIPVTLVAALLGGLLVLCIVVSMTTLVQSRVDDRYLGRVFGADRTTSALVALLGSLLAGVLGETAGVRTSFGLSGALFVVAGISGLTLLVPAARRAAGEATVL